MDFLRWLADIPPFSWLVSLVSGVGDNTFSWVVDRFPWIWIMAILLVPALFELLWWGVVVLRAKEVGFDPYKCTHDPRTGKLRKKKVDLKKATYRRYSWPKLGLPLFVLAALMFTVQLVWFDHSTYMVLALGWFLSAPIRMVRGIAVGRQVFRAMNPDKRLESSLWDDVWGYYGAGWSLSRPARYGQVREEPEPPFISDKGIWHVANLIWKYGRKLKKFWQIWRIFEFLRFWRLLANFVIAWFWPIAAIVTPFVYMEQVADFQWWHRPWWRAGRHNTYKGGVVDGEVVSEKPEEPGHTGSGPRRPLEA